MEVTIRRQEHGSCHSGRSSSSFSICVTKCHINVRRVSVIAVGLRGKGAGLVGRLAGAEEGGHLVASSSPSMAIIVWSGSHCVIDTAPGRPAPRPPARP